MPEPEDSVAEPEDSVAELLGASEKPLYRSSTTERAYLLGAAGKILFTQLLINSLIFMQLLINSLIFLQLLVNSLLHGN